MSDIDGNAFTIHAAEKIEKAIESLGTTASKTQVGKAVTVSSTGAKLGAAADVDNFIGIVKAVSGEGVATFATSKIVNGLVNGGDVTEAPYYDSNVTVPAGGAFTVERNCISYVLFDGDVAFGDPITLADDGKFKKAGSSDTIIGRVYGELDSNNVARAYIKAI